MAALAQILVAPRTDSAATTTTTYAVDSTVFTTGTPDWTIFVEVSALSAGAICRFTIQDSVDAFTTTIAGPTFELAAQIGKTFPVRHTFKRAEFPGLRFSVASGVVRIALTLLQGVIPSVTWWAGYQGPFSN